MIFSWIIKGLGIGVLLLGLIVLATSIEHAGIIGALSIALGALTCLAGELYSNRIAK